MKPAGKNATKVAIVLHTTQENVNQLFEQAKEAGRAMRMQKSCSIEDYSDQDDESESVEH